MFGHLSTHVVTEYLAINAKSLTAYTAIQLKLDIIMFITITKLFGFLGNLNSLMLGR